jgi:hypothetical protein
MAMKVQGSSVPAVQSQQTQQTAQTAQAAKAQQAEPRAQAQVPGARDEFVRHIPVDPGQLLGRERTTLDFGDRVNAANLSQELSSPTNALRLAFGEQSETIRRDKDGTYRGPEGQPLVEVKLEDGNTAFVDPNTNQFYLSDGQPGLFGTVQALPAQDLPPGSRFSNSHFSDADVKELSRIAKDGSVFGPRWPPQLPRELPELPRDFPRLPDFKPIPLANKGVIQG